jgi:hypothetical protein
MTGQLSRDPAMAHFLEGSSSLEEHDMAIPYYHVDGVHDTRMGCP